MIPCRNDPQRLFDLIRSTDEPQPNKAIKPETRRYLKSTLQRNYITMCPGGVRNHGDPAHTRRVKRW